MGRRHRARATRSFEAVARMTRSREVELVAVNGGCVATGGERRAPQASRWQGNRRRRRRGELRVGCQRKSRGRRWRRGEPRRGQARTSPSLSRSGARASREVRSPVVHGHREAGERYRRARARLRASSCGRDIARSAGCRSRRRGRASEPMRCGGLAGRRSDRCKAVTHQPSGRSEGRYLRSGRSPWAPHPGSIPCIARASCPR